MNDLNIIQAYLLLFGHSVNRKAGKDRYHSHSCWQMELAHQGSMNALFDKESMTVSAGEILIIPPGFKHAFEYSSQSFSTWSFKFNLKGLSGNSPIRLLPSELILRQAEYFIKTIFKNSTFEMSLENAQISPPDDFKQLVLIESIISGLTAYAYIDNKKESFTLADKVRSMIKTRNGKALTVSEAAQKLGYSRSHLSLLFKKDYGVPLKNFIDCERIEIAKTILVHTEKNISETALAMGFNDVYYFSNFFKRLTGKSPLNYLKDIKDNFQFFAES